MKSLADNRWIKARMPSVAFASQLAEGFLPALLATILLVFLPYATGVILHAFGMLKNVSVTGLGNFDAALVFLMITALVVRGTIMHALLSAQAIADETRRGIALRDAAQAEEEHRRKVDRFEEIRKSLNAGAEAPVQHAL